MDVLETVYKGVAELEHVLGIVGCRKVVSGNMVPGFCGMKTTEDPMHMTDRILVRPMLDILGYERDTSDGRIAVVTATANSPVPGISRLVIGTVRSGKFMAGIGTDGFAWILVRKTGGRVRVSAVHDIQEHYLEAFEMRRFRSAIMRGRGGIASFLGELSRMLPCPIPMAMIIERDHRAPIQHGTAPCD